MKTQRKLLSVLISSVLLSPLAIHAQETETKDNIEVIQVSAQKRQQSIQDVPISMSAFDDKSIERIGATDFVGLTAAIPSINVQTGSGAYPVTYIRGIGTNDTSIGADPSVGVYIDGVYASRLGGALTDFLDVERVEVLKGPQGTLFGRNSIGGAISIITKKPTNDFEGKVGLDMASFGTQKASGVVNIPISEDELALRVFGSMTKSDGWQKNTLSNANGGKKDRLNAGFKVRWQPSDSVEINMSNTWSDFDDISTYVDNISFLLPSPISDLTQVTNDRTVVNGNLDAFGNPAANLEPTAPVFTRDLVEHWVDIEWSVDDNMTFNSLTTYRDYDTFSKREYDGTEYMIAENAGANETNTTVSQEFRLTSETDDLFWVLGTSYLEEEAYLDFFLRAFDVGIPLAGAPFNGGEAFTERSTTSVDTESFAIFGDANYQLNDKMSLTLGARYSKDDKTSRYLNGFHPDGLDAFGGLGLVYPALFQFVNDNGETDPSAAVATDSWTDFSPRAVIDYKDDNILYYASVTKGYKSGAFNSFPTPDQANNLVVTPEARQPVAPESVINYEAGIKANLLDQALTLNVSYYYMDYSELQVFQVNQTVTSLVNAGEAVSSGFEFDGRYILNSEFAFNFNGTLMDTEYKEYVNGGVDYAGTDLLNSPEFSGSVMLDYETETSLGYLNAFVTYTYKGKHLLANDYEQDSYSLVNANVSLTTEDDAWEFALYAKNLTDKTVFTQTSDNVKSFGARGVVRNEPRTVGVSVRYNF